MPVTDQLIFTEKELLADARVNEPLVVRGLRCHGGFNGEGIYVSPRSRFRSSAIAAWQKNHVDTFGTRLIDVPIDIWGGHYPNVAQTRFLVTEKVVEPIIAALTRLGTVEGFGANIRLLQPRNLQRWFAQDIRGTAIDHLGGGLFEAHGRDEAGWGELAGHRDMWFAARDIAFESPTMEVDLDAMLARLGYDKGGAPSGLDIPRLLPDDINYELEFTVMFMIRVLLLEVSAFHTFRWAETWLGDTDLMPHAKDAAILISCMRADETPHVDYLATAITELRDRTWIGESGKGHAGGEMIGRLWNYLLDQSLGIGRQQARSAILGEVEYWCRKRPDGQDLMAEFDRLGD